MFMEKIKVAFIYKPSDKFLTGNHFDNTTYYFFMKALRRNEKLDVSYFPEEKEIDVKPLENKFDIILIPGNHSSSTPELKRIKNLKIPVISRAGDFHFAKKYNTFEFHEKFKIDYYFNFMDKNYFYKFYPKDYKYKTIIFGIEPDQYKNLRPFKDRIKNRIVNSGALGNPSLKSRTFNKFMNPKRTGWYFYKLRTKCNKLPYVTHTRKIAQEYNNYSYIQLLSEFQTSIAATTHYPTIKYLESTAAGCLTFMEITNHNNGKYLGFKDRKTSIFINEKNYSERFEEYLNSINDPKWEEIANNGRKFTLTNFSNDVAVKSLISLIEKII